MRQQPRPLQPVISIDGAFIVPPKNSTNLNGIVPLTFNTPMHKTQNSQHALDARTIKSPKTCHLSRFYLPESSIWYVLVRFYAFDCEVLTILT